MKKIILTGSLLICLLCMVNATVLAEDQRYPAQQGSMPGYPPPGEEDEMNQGTPPPPPPQNGMMKQGQPGMQKQMQPPKNQQNMVKPAARETIMERRDDKMQLRQQMISGVQQMREDMNDATNPGEMRDMKRQMRVDIHKMAGQMKEIRKENMNDRCKLVMGRISRITMSAGNGIGGKQKAFQAIADRFTKLSEKLAAKGVDVTELDAAIVTLNEKMATLETDYAAFIDSLDDTQQTECGNSDGAIMEAREAAAPAFELVQKDKMDIEEFLKNDMKAILEELRNSVPTGIPEPTAELTVAPTSEVN
jgi:hypothetical protein